MSIPLVVHGGTGFPAERAEEVIRLGVAKFNFGTNLKQAYLASLREGMAHYREPMNPHPFVGMGGPHDVLSAAREAVKRKVKELIAAYGGSRLPRPAQDHEPRLPVERIAKEHSNMNMNMNRLQDRPATRETRSTRGRGLPMNRSW